MKSVYIVLTNTGSIVNRAIKTVTDAPYNHASISLDKNLSRIYSFGRRQPINPFWGGFVKEDFVTGTFSWFPDSTCEIYQLQLTNKNYQRLGRIIHVFERKSKHYVYNYLGLVGVSINHPIQLPASYFCSQFVAEVLRRCGHPLFNKASALVTPDNFRNHKDLELIYDGELYQYPNLYSREYYQPKDYQSFPFRKYLKQQLHTEILGTFHYPKREYHFRDGFIKPKKIYLSNKIAKLKQARHWFQGMIR